MEYEIRCPRCDKLQCKIGKPITGTTEIEIKCYNHRCKTMMRIIVSDSKPHVLIEDITPKRPYPYPMRIK
jgi:phage FluMu protein Com